MKRIKYVIAALLVSSTVVYAAGKLQNSDFASSSDITGAGGTNAQLLNTSKIYDSTNAQLLDVTLAGLATGGGDVVGPASSVDGEVALFDSTTGKLIKRATGTGFAKLASGVLSAQSSPIPSADLNGGRTVNAQTGTTYTFALADGSMAGGFPLVTLSNASPITATVPLNSSVAFPIGTQIDLTQLGTGAVTVAAAGGVTINSAAPLTMGQYMGSTLVKTGTDAWSYFSGAATAISSITVASANGLAGSSSGGQTPALTLSTSVTGSVCANGTAFSACTTTGSGSTVLATSPTLVTPILGVAAATTINKVALTAPATGSTLTILDGKTFTSNNTLTLAGTDGSTLDIGTGGTLGTAAYTAASAYEVPLTFGDGLTRTANDIDVDVSQNITTLSNLTSNGIVTTSGGTGALSVTATTGSGNVVLATSPTITTPTIAKLANLTTNGYVKTSGGDGTLSVQTSPIPSSDVGGARTINAQTGTTYTFVLADGSGAGGYPVVTGANASPLTFTVPPDSSVAYPAGTQIDVCQTGAGKLTLAQGAGVTINSLSGNKAIGGQYVCVSLLRTASDVWLLTGNLIP